MKHDTDTPSPPERLQTPAADSVAETVPLSIDIRRAKPAMPAENVQKSGETISGIQRAGVELAKRMLLIISAALLTIALLVASSELQPTPEAAGMKALVQNLQAQVAQLPPDHPAQPGLRQDLLEMNRQIVDARQQQRAFWMQFAQMILLNLLMPVLTAILGYVFGANNRG